MKKLNYFQLIAIFYRAYLNYSVKGQTNEESAHRVFEDFWAMPEEKNYLYNYIVLLQYINIVFLMNDEINIELEKLYKKQINLVSTKTIEENLNADEIEHLNESIEDIEIKIKAMKRNNT